MKVWGVVHSLRTMDIATLVLLLAVLAAGCVAVYFYMQKANAPVTLASLAGAWQFTMEGMAGQPFEASINGTGLITIRRQSRVSGNRTSAVPDRSIQLSKDSTGVWAAAFVTTGGPPDPPTTPTVRRNRIIVYDFTFTPHA